MFFRMMFESGKLAPKYDYFRCVVNIPEDVQRVGEPSEAGEQVYKINYIRFSRKLNMNGINLFLRNSCLLWRVQ